MKKTFILFALLTLITIKANAQVFKGTSLTEISTPNTPNEIQVKASKELNLGNNVVIQKGDIIKGKVTDVVAPQKYHKNATFTFIPTEYTDSKGTVHKIEKEIKATYRQKMKPDFEHSEFGIGGSSDSMFVFSPSYIKNAKKILNGETREVWDDYQNRNTPWGKGEEISIKTNETIYFNFPDVE